MKPILIAGPCAAESEQQLLTTAQQMMQQGVALDFFRAGVWKPRSNPNSFSGVGEIALQWLSQLQEQYKVPVCVEVMNPEQVLLCEQYGVYGIWIGARTSVNPNLVQQIADVVKDKPFTVMVKNPMVPDLKLWAGNVERFLNANVKQVMAIHRGFADATEQLYRNSPCWEIPIDLKVLFPDLPILCDPSHLCGRRQWIDKVAQQALVYGFDGLMVECHCAPEQAKSDADQQLSPEQWKKLIDQLIFRENLPNRELYQQRALLEHVDLQLSELLSKRMKIVDQIAEIKRKNNLAVVQPHQWQQVKERYLKSGQDDKYQHFIEQFLELLHQSSIDRQKSE